MVATSAEFADVFKEFERVHGLHVQDVADRVALEAHCESFGIVTRRGTLSRTSRKHRAGRFHLDTA